MSLLAPVTHVTSSDSFHKQCMPTSGNSGTESILQFCGLQKTILQYMNIRYQLHPLSSSDSEEAADLLHDKETACVLAIFPLITMDLVLRVNRISILFHFFRLLLSKLWTKRLSTFKSCAFVDRLIFLSFTLQFRLVWRGHYDFH
jgi:hypothetical protein